MKIGEIICDDSEIELNVGRETKSISVTNKGDRPVQVGSHFHFFEVNKCLSFDRSSAYGFHLDIPSGMSVRFEPGETVIVNLCEFGGNKRVFGLNNLTCGQTSEMTKAKAMNNAELKGFLEK